MPSFKNPKVYTAHRSCWLQLLQSCGKKVRIKTTLQNDISLQVI